MADSVNARQVGGTHYGGGDFQHWDLISENFGPGYLVGCATKYICRWRRKDGTQALDKAEHYIEKLIALYPHGCFGTKPLAASAEMLTKVYGLTQLEECICQALLQGAYWTALPMLQHLRELIQKGELPR